MTIKRTLIFLIGLLAGALLYATLAATPAGSDQIIDTLEYNLIRGNPGDRILLGSQRVPDGQQGDVCDVSLTARNNQSIHPNNDIEIESATTAVFADVESVKDSTGTVTTSIVLGEKLYVYLRLGGDGVSSGVGTLRFDCAPPATTTTTTTVPSTTTTTQPRVITTTTQPPYGPPPTTLPPAEPSPPVKKTPTYTG